MQLNWQLLLALVLLTVGLYLLLAYRNDPTLPINEQCTRRIKRHIGISLITIAALLAVYFYYTGKIRFRATMPRDCNVCKEYVKRHRALRPYTTSEYSLLKNHATACRVCSDDCFKYVDLLQKNPPTDQSLTSFYKQELKEQRGDCAKTTEHAILANRELDRLSSKIRGSQAQFWSAAHAAGAKPNWDPFPKVPTSKIG